VYIFIWLHNDNTTINHFLNYILSNWQNNTSYPNLDWKLIKLKSKIAYCFSIKHVKIMQIFKNKWFNNSTYSSSNNMYTVNQFISNTNQDSMITLYQKSNSTFMNFYSVYNLGYFNREYIKNINKHQIDCFENLKSTFF
jgi:hypothetical protein